MTASPRLDDIDGAEPDLTTLRRPAFAVAYRMLGSVAEAEDIVQESFLRMHRSRQDGTVVENPQAFLVVIATRLAIDHLRSARVRRETYVGTWLPEPVIDEREGSVEQRAQMGESLSMAFLVLLETLAPVERAVFLLREVFDYDYGDIAEIVQKSEANCRQIFARAKRHVDAGRPRFEPSAAERDELARRFFEAARDGRLDELVDLLATDATFYGDGGGKAVAVPQPLHGRDRVARFLAGIFAKAPEFGLQIEFRSVNGQLGVLFFDREHRVISVFALDIAQGVIQAVRSVINPDKLHHLGPVSDIARVPERRPTRDA